MRWPWQRRPELKAGEELVQVSAYVQRYVIEDERSVIMELDVEGLQSHQGHWQLRLRMRPQTVSTYPPGSKVWMILKPQ